MAHMELLNFGLPFHLLAGLIRTCSSVPSSLNLNRNQSPKSGLGFRALWSLGFKGLTLSPKPAKKPGLKVRSPVITPQLPSIPHNSVAQKVEISQNHPYIYNPHEPHITLNPKPSALNP